jgi:hypothetical protein
MSRSSADGGRGPSLPDDVLVEVLTAAEAEHEAVAAQDGNGGRSLGDDGGVPYCPAWRLHLRE